MHIAPATPIQEQTPTAARTPWRANLTLRFGRQGDRSVLAERRHTGPLLVQKSLYPEGHDVCHAIIVHPPGGIAGGDLLTLDMAAATGAHALVTTPAATKWYKANGSLARQDGVIAVQEGAVMEWLPQENIVFDKAHVGMDWRVDLAGHAAFAAWDITCLGRRAGGETFSSGRFTQATRIYRDGKQVWGDLIAFKGGDPLMGSVVGLRGCSVFGAMIVAAGATPPSMLDRCRGIAAEDGAHWGVSALPDIFAARYLGHSAERAKAYFGALWAELRPWYAARPAHRPRIWDT